MSEPAVIFDNVSKSYPMYHHFTGGLKNFLFHFPKALKSMRGSRYEALRDISFEVRKGEALGIIGKNGAGKSTTLGLIAGVLKPTKASIVSKEDFYLTASRMVPYKKVDLIVEAFAGMPEKKLVVLGDGPGLGDVRASQRP